MTTATTPGLPPLHGDARRRAITTVGISASRPRADGEPTLVDLHPGPTREQLVGQIAALQAQNAWLQRQLEMRFEVLTMTVIHASFADASAALDVDCAQWPTDAFGTLVDQPGNDLPVLEAPRG